MKAFPLVALQAALVAAGIFVYDTVRGGGGATEGTPGLVVSGTPGVAPGPGEPAVTGLAGRGDLSRFVSLEARMGAIEGRMTGLETIFRALTEQFEGVTHGAGGLLGTRGVEAASRGEFDEPTIAALRVHLDEVKRRERLEQRQDMFRDDLRRAEVDLPPERLESVVNALVAYQDDALELIRGAEGLGLRGAREERQGQFEVLRERFRQKIREMVGGEEAEKILGTRLAETGGFFRGPDDPSKPPR